MSRPKPNTSFRISCQIQLPVHAVTHTQAGVTQTESQTVARQPKIYTRGRAACNEKTWSLHRVTLLCVSSYYRESNFIYSFVVNKGKEENR